MFRLNTISLIQFRNYKQNLFSFSGDIIGICGKNGSGKTNLLDAIYYLCFTKSYFGKTDIQNIQQGELGFRVDGQLFLKEQKYNISAVLRENTRKEFTVNNESYTRFSTHIGRFPCVMIAPDDVEIITGTSEERRKFIDYTLSQIDSVYLQSLIDYNKLLQQRNSLLKQSAESNTMDENLMEVISNQLIQSGNIVYNKRKQFLQQIIPKVIDLYKGIAAGDEKLTVSYKSHLASVSFRDLLIRNRTRDITLQRTTQGVHRDDLELFLNGYPFKTTGSQGQRKSLLFALKLAEFGILQQHTGFPPLLLLDDIFEKLDEDRMKNLLFKVCVENKGQVFITDTHCDRLRQSLEQLQVEFELIKL